jgi:hypothetical protein
MCDTSHETNQCRSPYPVRAPPEKLTLSMSAPRDVPQHVTGSETAKARKDSREDAPRNTKGS